MPVTFIGSNTAANASIASLSMTHGLTILEGDVLIAICNGNDTTTDGITDNNGSFPFTEAHQEAHQPVANTGQFAIFYRVAGASEPTSYTFDQSGTDRFEWILMQFRGVDVNDIFDVAPGVNSAFAESGTTATAPAITTTVNNAFAIAAFYLDSTSSFSAYTNSYTNEVEAGTHNQAIAAVSKEIATAGATGAVAATISADRPWTAHHFALKPLILASGVYDSGGNTGSTWTVPISNPKAGNLLVALGTADKDTAFANVPTGWTRVVSDIAVTAGVSSQLVYKISDGTETGVTFDITPTSVSRAGVYVELDGNWYRELDTTASNSNATAGTSLSTGSTGTPGAALEVALAFFGADSAQNVDLTRAYNTGFTEVEFTGAASAGTPSAQVAVKPLKTAVAQACTFVTTDTGDQLLGIASIFGPPEIVEVGAVSTGELNVSATSGSITHGLDIQAGDFIVAIVHVNLGTNTIADNNGANSFTERIADRDHSAASSTYAVFDRVAGASEPATYSWNGWTAAEWGITLAVFRGVNTSDPYDIAWSTTNETSVAANTSLASANPSTSGANAKALLFAGTDSDPFTWGSINNGFSARSLGNVGRPTGLYSKTIDTAGSIGTTTLTWTGTNDMFTIMAALKPAGGMTLTDVADFDETPGSGTEAWDDGTNGLRATGTGFM